MSTGGRSDLSAAFDSLHDLRDRRSDRDTILLRTVAVTERDRSGGPVVLAGDEHERHLGLLGGADLLREPVVRGVDLDANPLGLEESCDCLLYTSDAADDLTRVDLGGRR